MILANIISEFQGIIEDDTYWNTARATALVNQGMRALAARFGSMVKGYTTLTTVADERQYAIPVDYICNHLLWFNSGYNQKITLLDNPDDLVGVVGNLTTSGYPTHGYLWNVENRIDLFLYPVPDDAYELEWFYYREPPKVENNNDEPLIPRELHKYIIDYMELRAKVQDKELSDAQFEVIWEKKITEIRAARSKAAALTGKQHIPDGTWMMPNVEVGGSLFTLAKTGDVIW